MKYSSSLLILSLLFFIKCSTENKLEKPPLAIVKPVEETYFGKKIIDPYRYMESLKDTSVQKWMKLQSNFSRNVLNNIPGRQKLIDKMKEFDQRKSAVISLLKITENDIYFYCKRTPTDDIAQLYMRNGFSGKEEFLFNPAEYGEDSTQKYIISEIYPSDNGSNVVIEIAPNGSESSILLILDIKEKKFLPEKIDRVWFAAVSWLPDNNQFFFIRLNSNDVHDKERVKNPKIYIHKLNSDPSNDLEFFSNSHNPELNIKPEEFPFVSYDKNSGYLFAAVATVNKSFTTYYSPVTEIKNPKIKWKQLFLSSDNITDFYTSQDDMFFLTFKNATNFKILKTSLKKPDIKNAETVIPESPTEVITSLELTNNGLYFTKRINGVEANLFFLQKGKEKAEKLKLPYSAGEISFESKGTKFDELWINISGWTNSAQRFRYLSEKNEFRQEDLSTIAEYPEYNDLIVEEVLVPSHDGLKIPLSIIYKKGMKKNGANPVFITGYGAYGYSYSPYFSPNILLWPLEGGILAVAHVRGGGEFGDTWHKGGYKTSKPNTWKDLISCTEYLINEKYTSPQNIAINSASAGGVLIGRALTERPDLFAAAIPVVGEMNTLRSEEGPTGPVNTPEFGTIKDSIECMALIEMDSYLHIKKGTNYPAALITAGINDPRVIAWQPAKFAARLQAENSSNKLILFLADYEAGHGVGDTKSKHFESMADILSFALWQTGNPNFKVD